MNLGQGLLNDYHNFLFDLRGEEKVYKTSYIKTLISEEFKDQIIFRNRYQKNESTLVFSRCGGGSFLESVLISWGLPIEDLLHVARQVKMQKVYLKCLGLHQLQIYAQKPLKTFLLNLWDG